MIVVTLIGIMTAMIVPEMKGTYEDALLRSTSRELLDAFQMAHSRAISFNQPHRVRIQPDTGEYVIEKLSRQGGQQSFIPLRDVPGSRGTLDSRVKIEFHWPGESTGSEPTAAPGLRDDSAPGEAVTFYADGTAENRDVLLQDRQGFRLALRVNPITSRVKIIEVPRL